VPVGEQCISSFAGEQHSYMLARSAFQVQLLVLLRPTAADSERLPLLRQPHAAPPPLDNRPTSRGSPCSWLSVHRHRVVACRGARPARSSALLCCLCRQAGHISSACARRWQPGLLRCLRRRAGTRSRASARRPRCSQHVRSYVRRCLRDSAWLTRRSSSECPA
jgi:hypothetical protein